MTIKTRNEEWGFWGTASRIEGLDVAAAWTAAIAALAEYGMGEEMARDFLDSRYGRHLADAVQSPRAGGNVRSELKRFSKWIAQFKKTGHDAGFGDV